MLDQKILDAIRTNPETVEWFNSYDNCWVQYNKEECFLYINDAAIAEWRIKTKPYEARHEIWVSATPLVARENKWNQHFGIGLSLSELLLGYTNNWSEVKSDSCTKKVEIIIREIIE